ncbi:DUF2489 domain-containing protein [Halomonas sp. 18H]|uniref:DUF2489 domain-containing protein n=1 Tax=Halomonas almeriensis TaxID=308163 RepID=UPI00222F0167|nr:MULTISPECIES: DUF2489 domain-containing protein [Halomonas]MCW4151797.1 DUF2489 domain-containing protein [Halomonas sp. 18H]MDN3554043.1 DUF2489 domain-containing protein [Halomonas almeriensis]
MTTSIVLLLLGLALAVVAGLAVYAVKLWREVRRREAFRQDELRRAHENCVENLELVASALQQGQVDITEGAWRCKTLLDILDSSLAGRPEFIAFSEVHERTRHLHTHSARQALTPKERFREDRERWAVEHEWRDAILESAGHVVAFRGKWPGALE